MTTRMSTKITPILVRHKRNERIRRVEERTGGVGVSTPSARAGASSVWLIVGSSVEE